jgi:hypothetical protein
VRHYPDPAQVAGFGMPPRRDNLAGGLAVRILMLTRFYLNGQTTHVLELCHALQRKGHNVFLIASRLDHPGYAQWLKEKGIPFSRTHRPSYLVNNLRVMQFDVIHNHSAHAVVAISDEMAAQLPFPREQIRIVENGVPIPRFVNLTNRPKAAVVLARVNEARQRAYAQTVDILREKGWEVMVAGGWRYPGTRSLGWTQNPQLVLERARLVVGTGRAVREGMAAGYAALVLGDMLDGLVTPENAAVLRRANFSGRARSMEPTPSNLRQELAKLESSGAGQLMRFSRAYAQEHFGIDKMAAEIVTVYREAAGKGKTGGSVK